MAGRLINGIKYVGLMNDNSFKSKSLEDNVYFTLRDIFWNGDPEQCMTANQFNGFLTNNVSFEERDKNFKYTNLLYDYNYDYTKKLYNWLLRLTGYKLTTKPNGWKDGMFEFQEVEEDDPEVNDIDMTKYMKYDDWLDQLQELIKKLEEQLRKHEDWEAEDVGRDCDRLAELEDDEREDEYFCEYGCGGEYDYEPCGPDEILDGGPGSYPEWLNEKN